MSDATVTARPRTLATIGGIPVERLAARVGSTPFFAYDRARLSDRVGLLRAALPHDLELTYAVKANPMPALVQHLSGIVDGLDVASGAEMRVALDTPLPAHTISFAGPGKSPTEIEEVVYGTGLVRDAVALGVDDDRLGQHIVLAVSPANGHELLPETLLAELRQQLPLYMVPKHVVVRPTLPRSPNDKFDRNLLRQELTAA